MKSYRVDSSNLKELAYDAEQERLFVTFSSGSEYAYEMVPKEIVCNLMFSHSIGKTFHSEIKSKYVCAKVRDGRKNKTQGQTERKDSNI